MSINFSFFDCIKVIKEKQFYFFIIFETLYVLKRLHIKQIKSKPLGRKYT